MTPIRLPILSVCVRDFRIFGEKRLGNLQGLPFLTHSEPTKTVFGLVIHIKLFLVVQFPKPNFFEVSLSMRVRFCLCDFGNTFVVATSVRSKKAVTKPN